MKRIARLFFMEPNRLSPMSAPGKALFRMESHTPHEHSLTRGEIKGAFSKAGLIKPDIVDLFPYSYAFARILRKCRIPATFVSLMAWSELFVERVPIVGHLSSTLVVRSTRR